MYRHLFHTAHAFSKAHRAAARCARQGDLVGADKWLKIAERHERLAQRLYKLREIEIDLGVHETEAVAEKRRLRKLAR